MRTEAQKRAHDKDAKKNARMFALNLRRSIDADIISYLEGKENINAYLKELVRMDMRETDENSPKNDS